MTVLAITTETVDLHGDELALEVGTGSGNQTALLLTLSRRVESIEILEPLAQDKKDLLRRLRFATVTVYDGDGHAGLPSQEPFDRIIAAAPVVPSLMFDILALVDKMVKPIGPRFESKLMLLIEKLDDARLATTTINLVRFVPMVHNPGE